MQRHAIAHVQQPRRHHRDPRAKVSVVYVDMLHTKDVLRPPPLQSQREASSQPRVQQRLPALHKSFPPLENHALQQVRDSPPTPQA